MREKVEAPDTEWEPTSSNVVVEDRVDSRFDTDDLRTRDSYIAGVDKLRYEGCCNFWREGEAVGGQRWHQ